MGYAPNAQPRLCFQHYWVLWHRTPTLLDVPRRMFYPWLLPVCALVWPSPLFSRQSKFYHIFVFLSNCIALKFSLRVRREKEKIEHLQGTVSHLFCASKTPCPCLYFLFPPSLHFATSKEQHARNVRERSNDQVPKWYSTIPSPQYKIPLSPPSKEKGWVGGGKMLVNTALLVLCSRPTPAFSLCPPLVSPTPLPACLAILPCTSSRKVRCLSTTLSVSPNLP